jgi:hypothetical protein
MPLAAMALSVGRSSRMAVRGVFGWASGSAFRTALALALTAMAAAFAASAWWPDSDYRPIRPGERGTIGDAVTALPKLAAKPPAFVSDEASAVAPEIVTPALEPQQREVRRGQTGRAEAGRIRSRTTAPAGGHDDGAQARTPDSIWEDGDWSAGTDEQSSARTDPDTPDASATPAPAPATQDMSSEATATPVPPASTPTATATPAPTETATATPTPTETATPTPTPAETASPTPTGTADPSPTASVPETKIGDDPVP